MTIPTVVANYQTKSWNTAAQVFERKLEEALKTMNTQQTLAGYNNTEDFVNELSKHFKITKICKNDELTDCFEDKVFWGNDNEEVDMTKIKNAKNFGQENWDTETIGLQFANGTTGIVAYNPDCRQDPYSNQITETSCLALLYDTSGMKNPNTQNKDLRSINVVSLGGSNCAIELSDGTCFGAPFKPQPMSNADCQSQKNELGIKYCQYGNDYWAGAVKQCGGIGKMPTDANLELLARELYKDINSNFSGNRNDDLAGSMGFDVSSSFAIWSNVESSNKSEACKRYFNSNRTYSTCGSRTDGTASAFYDQSICLLD